MLAFRRNSYRLLSALLVITGFAPLARAADSILDVVPSTALAWGAVNHMDAASEKVQGLAKIVQVPTANLLESIKKESGLEKGLNEKGAAGFFVVPGKTEKDPVAGAFFVAVENEKEFLGNFEVVKEGKISEVKSKSEHGGSTSFLAFLHGYALIADKTDRGALEAAVEAKQSIATEMKGYESWLAENDASMVGTAAGIKFAAKQAQDELKKSKDAGTETPDAAAMMKSLEVYLDKSLQAAPSEFSLVMAGIRCDKQSAIRLIGRARLVQGGKVAKTIATIPPLKENLLTGVPGGPFVFAMAGVGIPGMWEGYMNLYGDLMKSLKPMGGMSSDDMDKLTKESLEAVKQMKSMSFVMKLGKRSDPIYSNMYATINVEHSDQLLALQEKYAAAASKLMQGAKQNPIKSITAKRLQVAGKPALQQEMTFDLSSLPGSEATRPVMDQLLGVGGKMLMYYVAADDHTVVMGIGVPQERMAAAVDVLKQPKKSLAEDADVAVTAAMLPEKSQWVAYVSFRGYSQLIVRFMAAALKTTPGAEGFQLPVFPKSPPLGLAVKATSDELHVEIAVPPALVQATGDYMKEMQAMILNRMMEQNHPPAP